MDVSIIICTRNRSYAIRDCLDATAISVRNVPNITTEIIIVDNNSTDDTPDITLDWISKNTDINARLLKEEKTGLSNARNCGVSKSIGDLVIFTDDDCRMDKNYISDAIKYNDQDKTPIIRGGRIELGDPSDLLITTKTIDEVERWSLSDNTARSKTLRGAISGCNMVMRKEILRKVGIFDPKLGAGQKIAGSEDTDFFYRAYLKGVTIEYVPDMCVYHFHGRKTKEDGFKILKGYSIGAGALYIKYALKHPNFLRPFIWSLRDAIKEIRTGKNHYMPELGLSYKGMVLYNIKGMYSYLIARILP